MSTAKNNFGTGASKAWALALAAVAAWVAHDFFGIDVPDHIEAAVAVLLVWAVPNRN